VVPEDDDDGFDDSEHESQKERQDCHPAGQVDRVWRECGLTKHNRQEGKKIGKKERKDRISPQKCFDHRPTGVGRAGA